MTKTKQETLLAKVLAHAKAKGVQIVRGPVFDWGRVKGELPEGCNAIGAVLLYLGKQDLLYPRFTPGWQTCVEEYLEANSFWIHRFCLGWDRGHQVLFTIVSKDKKKETIVSDEVSQLALRMRKEWCY